MIAKETIPTKIYVPRSINFASLLFFDSIIHTNTLFKFYQVCTLIINRFHLLILYCAFLRITRLELTLFLKIWYEIGSVL